MKKILAILTVLFATSVATSCVKPYQYTEELTIDNYDLTLNKTASKKDVDLYNVHYFQIIATGPWEATLIQKNEGTVWCYLNEFHRVKKKDEKGEYIKDEYGRYEFDKVNVVEGIEAFPGEGDRFKVVRGKAGTTYLPMEYVDNQDNAARYAILHVRRLDVDCEKWVNITQNK